MIVYDLKDFTLAETCEYNEPYVTVTGLPCTLYFEYVPSSTGYQLFIGFFTYDSILLAALDKFYYNLDGYSPNTKPGQRAQLYHIYITYDRESDQNAITQLIENRAKYITSYLNGVKRWVDSFELPDMKPDLSTIYHTSSTNGMKFSITPYLSYDEIEDKYYYLFKGECFLTDTDKKIDSNEF